MKVFKILSHPYTLIICFLMILISGENWGGVYAFYLLIALPFGGVHALLALLGIFILLISHHWLSHQITLKQLLNVVGILFLFGSLFYFFQNDKNHFNWGTFQEVIPLTTIVITAIIAACFLIGTFILPFSKKIVVH